MIKINKSIKQFIALALASSLSTAIIATSEITAFASERQKIESTSIENLINYDEKIIDNKKVVTLTEGNEQIKLVYNDKTGNYVEYVYENGQKMKANEYLDKYTSCKITKDENLVKSTPLNLEKDWYYAYTTNRTFSQTVTSTAGMISLLMTASNLAYSVAVAVAQSIINTFGGIGSFIEFYMVGKVYQKKTDIHSWRTETDYYKKPNKIGWFKHTTGYFSTRLPIGPQY